MAHRVADEHREHEVKLDVGAGWTMPDLGALVPCGRVDTETVRLVSTYFDTEDLRLIGSRLTLRRRTGDTDTGWQLKVPDAGARLELRWPVDGRSVPAEIREATLGIGGGAALVPVATLTTVRHVHRLVDADDHVLAEAVLDEVDAARADGRASTRWQEVEVELVDGGPKVLRRAGKLLRAHGALRSSSASKVGRALGIAAEPDHRPGTLARLMGDYLDAQWEVIVRGDLDLRRGEYAVHPIRIAVRRYRSVLRILRPVLDEAAADRIGDELAAFASVIGAVRDLDVIRAYLQELLEAPADDGVRETESAADAIAGLLAAERESAEVQVQSWLRSRRHLALLADLRAWHRDLPLDPDLPAGDVIAFLHRADRTARKRLAAIPEVNSGAAHDEAMHRARKAAKRARYIAELSAPVAGADAGKVADRHKKIQTRLGTRQDAVIAAQFLQRVVSDVDGLTGFALGALFEKARADAMR